MSDAAPPLLEHIANLVVRVAAPTVVSSSRRIIGITGGEILGPKIHGKVLAGGADFQVIRPDHTTELEARYVLETDSGSLIYVVNTGYRHGPPEAMERLQRGETVDPALIYFRCTPRFETAAPEYQWLTKHVFVGTAARYPDRVEMAFYQLL
jgi:hypothetical protein